MYFKTTSNHTANASISNKDICKLCIRKEEKEERLKQYHEYQKEKEEREREYQRKEEERRIENQRKQGEILKEAHRLDSIIQFKKNRIIRKRGFFNKDYNYSAQCKKCDAIYDAI